MASESDISNLALSHLGDDAQVAAIKPPDGSMQSTLCARFYPIARDALLEMHPWTFAVKRKAMTPLTNPWPDDWTYAYALPANCLRPLSALSPGAPEAFYGTTETDAGSHPYIVETLDDGGKVLYTNVETATLRYISLVTDPTRFTPGFVVCLARLLASYLAGPIIKGDTGMKVSANQMQMFAREYATAAARDSNTGRRDVRQSYAPSWLAARGVPRR